MKYTKARELISEAIEQIDEADGNPAPYGWNVKKSPSGRKRYIPKTKEQWHKESEKFHAKNPGHWERVKAFQKANPLNPDLDDHITGPDDHLPGGVGKKAGEERQAAIKAHRRRQGLSEEVSPEIKSQNAIKHFQGEMNDVKRRMKQHQLKGNKDAVKSLKIVHSEMSKRQNLAIKKHKAGEHAWVAANHRPY